MCQRPTGDTARDRGLITNRKAGARFELTALHSSVASLFVLYSGPPAGSERARPRGRAKPAGATGTVVPALSGGTQRARVCTRTPDCPHARPWATRHSPLSLNKVSSRPRRACASPALPRTVDSLVEGRLDSRAFTQPAPHTRPVACCKAAIVRRTRGKIERTQRGLKRLDDAD